MTREEAIAYGKRVIGLGLNDETQAFCELAIKALEQEPTTINDSPKYCDRSICLKNEYNNVGCEDCEVTKSQEPTTQERQAESDKFDAAFQDGYNNGYAQARFDYEQELTTKNDLGVDCIDKWDIGGKEAELWIVKGKLQVRHRGTIHNIDLPLVITKNNLGVDLISRNEVLNRLASIAKIKAKSDAQKSLMGRCMFMVERMPSVTPQEPKTGHWNDIPKYKDIAWQCSECGHFTTMKHNYCPRCGAKMESEG